MPGGSAPQVYTKAKAMDLAFVLFLLFLAAVLGFAAHRSSVCTVLAVAEVLSTRRAYMFLSFVKTILWILAITLPLIWLLPSGRVSGQGWDISIYAVTGGFMFGVGATLNGGCAFSTLWKLGYLTRSLSISWPAGCPISSGTPCPMIGCYDSLSRGNCGTICQLR